VKKLLDVRFMSSNDQVADGFTKVLPQGKLLKFQRREDIGKSPSRTHECGTRYTLHGTYSRQSAAPEVCCRSPG
jgi:hypothetical protein